MFPVWLATIFFNVFDDIREVGEKLVWDVFLAPLILRYAYILSQICANEHKKCTSYSERVVACCGSRSCSEMSEF